MILLFHLLFYKSECQENSKQFIEKTIDFVIQNKDGNTIELPFIYDSLVSVIPEDSTENLLLVNVLKKKGFKTIDWGRGNYPPRGPRIVTLTMQKDDCLCERFQFGGCC